jgi:hypothetical protein
MYAFMTGQWFEKRYPIADRPAVPSRAAPPPTGETRPLRLVASAGAAPSDGRCCGQAELRAEPRYPYSSDWQLRCCACRRWHSPEEARREPAPAIVRAAFGEADALPAAS